MADLIHIVDDEGKVRFLGNVAPTGPMRHSWPCYGDTPETPMLPRSQFKAYASEPFLDNPILPPIHDQDGIGMCNCSATAAAMEYTRNRQGLLYVPLSGGDLYQRISGGVDRGSLLEDGLADSMRLGVASTKVTPYLDWRGENPGAREDRARYRVVEAFVCPTFDHCYSAAAAGFAVIIGVLWYSNYSVDADGWLPPGRGQAGGHALFAHTPVCRRDQFGLEVDNSWRETGFGRKGRGVIPEGAFGRQIGGFWAVRAVVDEGGVIPLAA